MALMTHGKEGSAYPVEPGQTWQVGNHLFHCSDLMVTNSYDELFDHWTPTLVYSDPPWGQALANSFRTTAGLGRAEYRWESLYERITDMAVRFEIPLWLEGSAPDTRDGSVVLGTMVGAGKYRKSWTVTYYGDKPSGLFYTGTEPYPEALTDSLVGMDDADTPLEVLQQTASSGVVIDPCAGRGQTSRCAEEAGWHSINNELSPYRTSASIARMEKMTGETPEQLT